MPRFMWAVFAALFVVSSQTSSGQTSQASSDVPDIQGVWRLATSEGIFGDQVLSETPSTEIIIDMQEGAVFSGRLEYEVAGDQPEFHDGSALTRMASEPILGVIGWDGRSLTIAERADTSLLSGELLNSETMALIYVEPGEFAFAARMLLVRQ
ncbi:MAG: hypothetical protein AAF414_06555 [Pseudomonadota bacterium]